MSDEAQSPLRQVYDPLYKRDRNGGVRVWSLERDGACYRTQSGLKDGVISTSGWTTCVGKNVGKKNGTTAETQAVAEVYAEYAKKLDRGYFTDEADIDLPVPFKPMLAHKYQDLKVPLTFGPGGLRHTGAIFTQPKLDGIRCIANRHGLWTRTGKKIVAVPHVWDVVKDVFEVDPEVVIDGELYNHDLRADFNEITSVVRKTKPSEEDLAKSSALMQYHVYDAQFAEDMVFRDRYSSVACLLLDAISAGIVVMNPTYHVENQVELDNYNETFALDGYEGQMIRLNGEYENTRSWRLLKRKEFDDGEFKIIRVEEGNGNWAGAAKRVIVADPENGGREQPCGMKGSYDLAVKILAMADELVGTDCSVRWFRRTPDGYLRMPVVQDFHHGKRND